MTDLHTHILPGIDDGAKSVDVAIKLLELERRQGVKQIVCTPHFREDRISVDEFLNRRMVSKRLLEKEMERQGIACGIKLGAEVYLTEGTPDLDISPLTIEGTNYLLVEFPISYSATGLLEILYEVLLQGVIPIIAHIERYPFAAENVAFLEELIQMGCVIQVNAATLLSHNKQVGWVFPFIKCGLIHILSSDTHSLENRAPHMDEAVQVLMKKCGIDCYKKMEVRANDIYHGEVITFGRRGRPKKLLGKWW